jgi:hypothetical protein
MSYNLAQVLNLRQVSFFNTYHYFKIEKSATNLRVFLFLCFLKLNL